MMKFRSATLHDLELLKYWDTKQHVIDCDPDEDWNWEIELQRSPSWRDQLIAELDGEPIGMVQIIDPFEEETKYWGEVDKNKRAIDIWIGEKRNLNKGYGTTMMKLVIARCFDNPHVTEILVDPLSINIKAQRFYERFGFEFVEVRDFDGTNCKVYKLQKMLWTESL